MRKLTVGQKLWFVSNHRGFYEKEVTITKLGRKWAELGNRLRINIETLVADGGDYLSPGRCYLSREEYERITARQKAWDDFRKDIHFKSIPDSVTVEDIEEAERLLGIANKNEK